MSVPAENYVISEGNGKGTCQKKSHT